eukprot:TRINITY_DN4806_c0_g1_i1.p1 TRINITY_DN4806_c0_g1~~TRINITY_DN4806_c0_g1_i1.p1  ORF type:complete len:324 (-),score=53.28 TRINITY_DN4806_c0_g1_i1:121-1092(-)
MTLVTSLVWIHFALWVSSGLVVYGATPGFDEIQVGSVSLVAPQPSPAAPTKPLLAPQAITINSVCKNNSHVVCPSGICEADPTNCHGTPSIFVQIQPTQFVVTKRFVNKTVRVNILDSDKGGVGWILFPPNMLRRGWNVSVVTSNEDSTTKDDDCNGVVVQQGSAAVDITITNAKGKFIRKFTQSFRLNLYGSVKGSNGQACVGFTNDDQRAWKCNNESDIDNQNQQKVTRDQSVLLVNTQSDHLTSFAVLLGASSSRGGCGEDGNWGWIEIASLVLIGSSVFLVTLVTTLYCLSSSFRSLVTGVDEDAAILKLQRVAAAVQE